MVQQRPARQSRQHTAVSTQQTAAGFTLFEVMLALVVFAVGTVAAMELLHRAQAGGADSDNVLIATQLAQLRLEELRNSAYASVVDEAEAAVATPTGFTRFRRQVTVTTPVTNVKQVVVRVTWDVSEGEADVALQTFRSAI